MAATFIVATMFASFFEWALHRYFMHRPVGKFDYAFRAHALVHHQTFKADHTYHLINEEDKHTIPMAWWNGPVLISVGMIPFLVGFVDHGHLGHRLRRAPRRASVTTAPTNTCTGACTCPRSGTSSGPAFISG